MGDVDPQAAPGADAGVAAVLGRAARRARPAAALRRVRPWVYYPRAALPGLPLRPPHVDRGRRSGHRVHVHGRRAAHRAAVRRRGAAAARDRRAHRGRAAVDHPGRRRTRTRSPWACRSSRCSTTAPTASPCCASGRRLTRPPDGRRPPVLGEDHAMGFLEDRAGLHGQGGADRRRGRWTRPGHRRSTTRVAGMNLVLCDKNEELLATAPSPTSPRRRVRSRSRCSSTCATPTR